MSARNRRLEKLLTVLTAKERIIAILRAWNRGQEEDPELRASLPPSQFGAFNRYMSLLWVANVDLAVTNGHLSDRLQELAAAGYHLQLLESLAAQLGQLPEDLDEDHRIIVGDEPKSISVLDLLRRHEGELRRSLQAAIRWTRQQARALEIVWAELALEFDGEPPALPSARQILKETKEGLAVLAKQVAAGGRVRRLPEPSDTILDKCREVIENAARLMKVREGIDIDDRTPVLVREYVGFDPTKIA
jgi:hypothetical protein